VRSSFSAPC